MALKVLQIININIFLPKSNSVNENYILKMNIYTMVMTQEYDTFVSFRVIIVVSVMLHGESPMIIWHALSLPHYHWAMINCVLSSTGEIQPTNGPARPTSYWTRHDAKHAPILSPWGPRDAAPAPKNARGNRFPENDTYTETGV